MEIRKYIYGDDVGLSVKYGCRLVYTSGKFVVL